MMASPPASERSAGSPVRRPAFLGGLGESSGNVLGVGSPSRRRRQECELDPLRGVSRAVVSGLDDRPDCWVQRYQNRLRNGAVFIGHNSNHGDRQIGPAPVWEGGCG
jgi:hypothetical protein